jgi:hypothetical protein
MLGSGYAPEIIGLWYSFITICPLCADRLNAKRRRWHAISTIEQRRLRKPDFFKWCDTPGRLAISSTPYSRNIEDGLLLETHRDELLDWR